MGRDSLAYPNELLWEYEPDPATGTMHTHPRDPKPTYHQYCFVMARAARQFFDFARFDPAQPKVDPDTYRRLVRKVLGVNPRSDPARREPVIIPGYADLHEFSRAYESLLKDACGGWWQSYVQRGHWRMLFPFSDANQAGQVGRLRRELDRGVAPVIHVVRFPHMTINHALLVYAAEDIPEGTRFLCYDPNEPDSLLQLDFHTDDRRFHTGPNKYFIGGRVDVYEVYRNGLY